MSDFNSISPLLDNLTEERILSSHPGSTCRLMRNSKTEESFVLKQLSVPASDCQIRALILSGAYPDEAAVHEYYTRVVKEIEHELTIGTQLAAASAYAAAIGMQSVPKDTGIGYDVYILYPLYVPLSDLLAESAITGLRAFNLGMDVCDALEACREAGYLFGNVKPENIYLMKNGRFLLGDLGLTGLEDLQYACVPEEYIGPYSAPELSEITASLNMTVDLYSLGMVLYRIYNGNHGPFEDEVADEAMAEKLRMTGKPLPTPIYADYELTGIILKACAFQPKDRFQTPAELKQALTLYMQRNEISDTLIIPPIVAAAPLTPEDAAFEPEDAETEPIRITDKETLDSTFRESFAPDTTGSGTLEDIDLGAVPAAPVIAAVPSAAPAKEVLPVQPVPTGEPVFEEPTAEAAVSQQPAAPSAQTDGQPEPDELLSDAETPDEQMDLDELLASVSEVVGPAPQPDGETQDTPALTIHVSESDTQSPLDSQYVDTDESIEPEEESKPVKGGIKPGVIATLAALIIGIGGLLYFLLSWYFVDVTQIRQVSCNTKELVVELVTEDSLDRFLLTCTDSHGISYALTAQEGSRYTFAGLKEDTTYTVSVEAVGSHKLRNADAYSIEIVIPKSTTISEFTAKRNGTEGEVLLSFRHDGLEPQKGWQLLVAETGVDEPQALTFQGNSTIVKLKENVFYIFTLTDTEDVYLSGETSLEYTLLPIVEAENLMITAMSTTDVTLRWDSTKNDPGSWSVSCDAEGASPISTTATECTLPIADFNRVNIITLSAPGMEENKLISLPANPIQVQDFAADANADGTLTVHWQTPVSAPEDGWLISYRPVGSIHDPVITDAVMTTSYTLNGLVPNTEYEIALLAASDTVALSRLFGAREITATTADLGALEDYSISPTPPVTRDGTHIALFDKPDEEDWTNNDLTERHEDGVFSANVPIIFLIDLQSSAASDDTVLLQYVVRNADGNVCNEASRQMPWNELWDSTRRHSNEIPLKAEYEGQAVAVTTPGTYTFEVYVNGKLLATIGFTIQ